MDQLRVDPHGFYAGEQWDGSHGEAWTNRHLEHPPCMCGHPNLLTCPEWANEQNR